MADWPSACFSSRTSRACPFLFSSTLSEAARAPPWLGYEPVWQSRSFSSSCCSPADPWPGSWREHANSWGLVPSRVGSRLTERGWAGGEAGMACEAGGGAASRRDDRDRGRAPRARRGGWPGGPRAEAQRGEAALNEAKQLTAALQAEMVSAQLAVVGERRRSCATCGRPLASKGHYPATFRSLFGAVPVRVRRLLVCPCHSPGEPKSFAALDLGAGPAPELAYVTAKFAALAPFGRVAALLSELLPISGAQNAGTVRNRSEEH